MTKKINQMAVRYRSLADGDGIAFKWESSLDKIFAAGNYAVKIEHSGADVGLPIEGCGTEHCIAGTLVVTDSGALDMKRGDRVIGQVLTFTLRNSKETSIYTRTYAGGEWGAWNSLARTGMYDEITNADALYSTVTSLVDATKKVENKLHGSIINYNEWKETNAQLSLPNVLADDKLVKLVKSGTILTFRNTSTTWKRFQYTAESTAIADVRNYSNWKELSGAACGIKQAVDAHKVQISITGENGGVKDILNISAATTERAGVMSAEDKKLLDGNVNSSSYSVVDAAGNVIFKVDKDGVTTTEVTTSKGKLGELLDALAAVVNALKETVAQTNSDVAGKVNSQADSDSFAIADAAGNVIFKVDKDGVHAPNLNVITPTWVIAQVLSEAYIPSNIVRDTAGDVVSCDALFSDGITGTIVLARENGEVSHIVATHGSVNAEAEIIREDGNVKQINIL